VRSTHRQATTREGGDGSCVASISRNVFPPRGLWLEAVQLIAPGSENTIAACLGADGYQSSAHMCAEELTEALP
jgi:hypothetical protein